MGINIEIAGIFGLLWLAITIWAIVKTVQSRASDGSKVIWILILIFLNFLGFVLWLFFGPKKKR